MQEFICATANLAKLEKEANILAAFKQFDTDHSGALTPSEIAEALSAMGSTDEEIRVRPFLLLSCTMSGMRRAAPPCMSTCIL
jgi:Ca2+-binding EF-hand superfamily protein